MTRVGIVRAAAFALIAGAVAGLAAQQSATLKITITVVDADGHVRPVPRHALLVSDNPATAAPQRVVTSLAGVATIRLPPGNYTVESDQPLVFQGKSYEWTRTLDIVAGRDSAIELTAADAEIGNVAASAGTAALEAGTSDASALLIDWQDSVVSIWSPTQLGAGFLIDARGLILTTQRLVRDATSVEVQFSLEKKVAASVLSADANRNVAILWIDPGALAKAKPFRIAPAQGDKPSIGERDKVWAIDTRLDEPKSLASGTVSRVSTHTITSDIRLDTASAGVPLLDASGTVVGITTTGDDLSEAGDVSPRAVRIEDAAAAIADADRKMHNAAPPTGTLLPVEPQKPFDDEALKEAVRGRAGSLTAYQVPAADFDVSIITPVLLYGNNHRGEARERGPAGGNPLEMQRGLRALIEFANWADYVSDYPPVILIRATPKMVEGFWTTVARGAAQTQGVSIPALKHVKTGFSAMRLFCGGTEVTPIHPFRIEQRVGETSVIAEGLYVYAPDAIGPECGAVKVTLISEKAPEKPDTRTIDPKILPQIQQDFAAYRKSR